MAGVFISYRRSDSGERAEKLYHHLRIRFGKDLIFKDIESLVPGEEWIKVIREKISECEVFLAIIGPQWLLLSDSKGNRRLDDEKDILRLEIKEALNKDCTIIPLLVGGAKLPLEKELPSALASLAAYQAAVLNDNRWNSDIQKLLDQLRELMTLTRGMVSLAAVQQETYQMQLSYFELLEQKRDIAGALELAQKTSRLLDRTLPLYPQDSYLKVSRGYSLKNEAMALRRLQRASEAEEALNEADQVFVTMRDENPNDAGAWNGSGSVEMLRGNYRMALKYIDKALEIDPNYEAAKRDRDEVIKRI